MLRHHNNPPAATRPASGYSSRTISSILHRTGHKYAPFPQGKHLPSHPEIPVPCAASGMQPERPVRQIPQSPCPSPEPGKHRSPAKQQPFARWPLRQEAQLHRPHSRIRKHWQPELKKLPPKQATQTRKTEHKERSSPSSWKKHRRRSSRNRFSLPILHGISMDICSICKTGTSLCRERA